MHTSPLPSSTVRAISAAITTLALAAGALVFFSGAAPAPAAYGAAAKGSACKSSSYCRHTAASHAQAAQQAR